MLNIISVATVAGLAMTTFAAPMAPNYYDPKVDPTVFPLSDGFPNPSTEQLKQIQIDARGTLSNAKGSTTLKDDSITNLQLVALNELFEVAYFNELLYNVTNKIGGPHGYDLGNGHDFVVKTLEAVLAQEKLHTLNANNALKANNRDQILPCKYSFPVENFRDAIALAATFTDLVMGTLQDVAFRFGVNGDNGNIRGVGSTLGQEGEQAGFYRFLGGKIPNALPFLTTSVRDFAFTAIQGFTLPGSCPNIDQIKLIKFEALTLLTTPTAKSEAIEFSFSASKAGDVSRLSMVFINQQNVPVVEKISIVGTYGDTVKATAYFPYSEFEMNGLTIAAIAKGSAFPNATEVAKATIFGPGLIEIN